MRTGLPWQGPWETWIIKNLCYVQCLLSNEYQISKTVLVRCIQLQQWPYVENVVGAELLSEGARTVSGDWSHVPCGRTNPSSDQWTVSPTSHPHCGLITIKRHTSGRDIFWKPSFQENICSSNSNWNMTAIVETHRLAYRQASCVSRTPQWWSPEGEPLPKPPAEAREVPGSCELGGQRSWRRCRSYLWHCTGSLLGPSQYPGWQCSVQCSCLCCWWKNVQRSYQYPTDRGSGKRKEWFTMWRNNMDLAFHYRWLSHQIPCSILL